MAAEATVRLGVRSPYGHLDTTSFHVDGRYNSTEEPDATVIHITQGYSRDHRPDRNHVMLELIVEHHAGIPVLMQPLSGNTNDRVEFSRVMTEHVQKLRTAHSFTYLVADSALYTAEHLGHLAQSGMQWIPRVPATLNEVHAVLARVTPATMTPLPDS